MEFWEIENTSEHIRTQKCLINTHGFGWLSGTCMRVITNCDQDKLQHTGKWQEFHKRRWGKVSASGVWQNKARHAGKRLRCWWPSLACCRHWRNVQDWTEACFRWGLCRCMFYNDEAQTRHTRWDRSQRFDQEMDTDVGRWIMTDTDTEMNRPVLRGRHSPPGRGGGQSLYSHYKLLENCYWMQCASTLINIFYYKDNNLNPYLHISRIW